MKKPAKMNHTLYTAELIMAASWGLPLMATDISPYMVKKMMVRKVNRM
jgi:hypothetical protein